MEHAKTILEIAEGLLDLQNFHLQENLVSQIQKKLQDKYRDAYRNINFKIDKNLSDDEIVNQIAQKSGMKNIEAPHIARQLPKFNILFPNAGFECTLATAMVRTALAEAGYKTRSLLLRRHFVAMREFKDGSIKVYDAATRISVNGNVCGFIENFSPNEVSDKKVIMFDNTKKGFVFTVQTSREIKNTEMFSKNKLGFNTKQFFAYEPEILVDIAVVLENLSQIKNQNDENSIKLCRDFPILKKLDYQDIKKGLNLFDAYDYLTNS